jgi:hypothetical protein
MALDPNEMQVRFNHTLAAWRLETRSGGRPANGRGVRDLRAVSDPDRRVVRGPQRVDRAKEDIYNAFVLSNATVCFAMRCGRRK